MKSGVSFELMNAAASLPAAPYEAAITGLLPSTRRPSVTVGGAATITTSPSDKPASTSVAAHIHEPETCDALLDDEDRRHLPAVHERARGHRQGAARLGAEVCAAERPRAQIRASGQRDLDEKRARVGIHRAADFRHRAADRRRGATRARVERDRHDGAGRDLSDPRLVHADVEPEAARILEAHERRTGRRHVARLDHLAR